MMVSRLKKRLAPLAGFVLGGFALPAMISAAEAPIPALDVLQPGQWELRGEGSSTVRSLCLGDPRLLLQIRHGSQQCSRFVIGNTARVATVQYSCGGAGNGRTTVRVETPRLVQIDTQGMADKSPFVMRFEGRRTGACTGAVSSAPQARRVEKSNRLGIR